MMERALRRLRGTFVIALLISGTVLGSKSAALTTNEPAPRAPGSAAAAPALVQPTYSDVAAQALDSLLHAYYNGAGLWRDCPQPDCWVHNGDWGSDALTDTLYLRWKTTRSTTRGKTTEDPTLPPILAALSRTARRFGVPCTGERCTLWSDVPMWDSVAASREHEVAASQERDSAASRDLASRSAGDVSLNNARAAFWAVEASNVYDVGACPAIRYQRPFGRGDRLKTLETDSNGVKAALLLYDETHDDRYLHIARSRYRAIRRYFLDPHVPLYSVYVFDDGRHCTQVPQRFFASVNGNMIWNGIRLYRITGETSYRAQALGTARAVASELSDPNGVFTDLQAENDLVEPLVEAMFVLATQERQRFARRWLLASASAAFSARKTDGSYGRFFDGPPPIATATAWQTSGGVATEVAAAALDARGSPRPAAWKDATFVREEIAHLPATIRFEGSGIALIGTLGDICCQPGHARIFVDGVETRNRTGAWQNKSSSGRRYPAAVLFAWRWRARGRHRITLRPGEYNAKEGGSYLRTSGYAVIGASGPRDLSANR